jgi:Heterokaryon incompatibility protein (HET)
MDLDSLVKAAAPDPEIRQSEIQDLPSFEYDKLGEDQIRVLTLLPGNDSNIIRCEFESLLRSAAASTFSALSYLWGPEPQVYDSIVITKSSGETGKVVGDSRLSIWPSLHDALVALQRASSSKQRFWIDALCINQKSVEEKTHQIRQMSKIYSGASSVTVWLGNAADDSDYVMDTIMSNLTAEYTTQRFMAAMIAVFMRPWFTRTWIVQEFVLNRKSPLIACGLKRFITWDKLKDAYVAAFPQGPSPSYIETKISTELTKSVANGAIISQLPDSHRLAMLPLLISWPGISWPRCHSAYTTLNGFRSGVQSTGNATYALRYALIATSIFNATDPRDKVYGVLGMTRDKTQQMMAPNYMKSVEEVFQDAMTHVLFEEESAALYTWFPLERASRPTLPSWVPNFAAPRAVNYMRLPSLVDANVINKHSAGDLRLSRCGKRLTVKGQVVDIIEAVVRLPAKNLTGSLPSPRDVRVRDIMDAIRDSMKTQDPTLDATSLSRFDLVINEAIYIIELSRVLTAIESLARGCTGAWPDFLPTQTLRKVLVVVKSDTTPEGEAQQQFDRMIQTMRELTAAIDTDDWRMQIGKIATLLDAFMNTPGVGDLTVSLDSSRKFFTGHGGWYGVTEGEVEAGDELAVLFPGGAIPFVIRDMGADEYEMIGIARTHSDSLTTGDNREFTFI